MHKIFTVLLLCAAQLAFSQSARLKVWLDPISESLMMEKGMELDHGEIKKGVYIINDFSARERQWIEESGIRYDVIIEDVEHFYATRTQEYASHEARGSRSNCDNSQNESFETPDNFELGSMGSFFTYEEFLAHLDSMAVKYPNLITTRAPIDTFQTHQGREIYWLKISDNPSVSEAEPQALYTAIHHAREPQSLAQLIFFMWYVLENYGSDDEVTHLVNNTEMYVIPMINPDGYIQNQTTNPNGGGLWRKNMRDNLDGEFGVDLNRNYGFEWAYDNSGSSPQTNSPTYRGPAPFSEPEARAVKWFCEQHQFELALNYHSSGNYLIYPWGYIPSPLSPDSNYFIAISELMTAQNNYVYGTGYETVNYATNGVSDDWMYGEQTSKNKIYSMTPEVGNSGDGFWPVSSRIIPLSEENVRPNLLLSHFAGDYATMIDESPLTLSSQAGSIDVTVQRLGQGFTAAYTFALEPISANVTVTSGVVSYSSMNVLEEYEESFDYELDASIEVGDEVAFDLVATFNGYESRQRILKIYGTPTLALSNSANDTADFKTNNWAVTNEDFVSSPTSITDSPFSQYGNNQFSEIEYERIIDMRQSITGYLTFSAQWQLEAEYDYCQLLAAPLGTNSWTPLCGLYTKEGSQNQDEGQPLWDGNRLNWVNERVDLNDFTGQRIKIKFRMVSDAFVTYDGYYFDDLKFYSVLDESLGIPLDTGYTDSIVGIQQYDDISENISLFPNPASDLVYIKSEVTNLIYANVYSMNGQLIESFNLRKSNTLNVSSINHGLYMVEIGYKNGRIRKPLLISR